MTRDIVERLKETAIMLPRSGYVSVGHEATEAADEITALRARLEAVEKDRNAGTKDYCDLMDRHDAMAVRAERAEAALVTARRDALEGLVAIVRRDEQAGDISPGAAQWFADSASTLIAQEQDTTGGKRE